MNKKSEKLINDIQASILSHGLQITANTTSSNILSDRLTAQEKAILPLDARLTTLETTNRTCDFPNSLTTLVQQKLHDKFNECLKRLNNIEKMENEFD